MEDYDKTEIEARTHALAEAKKGAISAKAETISVKQEHTFRSQEDSAFRLSPDGTILDVVVGNGQRNRFTVSELFDEKKAAQFAELFNELCTIGYKATKALRKTQLEG